MVGADNADASAGVGTLVPLGAGSEAGGPDRQPPGGRQRLLSRLSDWRPLLTVLFAFAIPLVVTLWNPTVGTIDPWGLRVLAVVAAALVLWLTEVVTLAISSLALVTMLALVAPGDSGDAMDGALVGFQNSSTFFILGALILGLGTVRSGLARRFARMLVTGARGSGVRLYVQMVAMMPLMATLVPSALTRTSMLIPAYEEVFRRHGIERGHPLPRLVMIGTATLQILASTAVLTGGAVPVVAGALLGGLSWVEWFVYMALPCYLILLLFAIALFIIYRPGMMPEARDEPLTMEQEQVHVQVQSGPRPGEGPIQPVEWRALCIIAATTLIWLTDGIHHLDPTIPALLGATVLLLPVIGVLRWEDVEASPPWPIVLVTGSSLSLAVALQESGAASWLADGMVGHLPLDRLPLIPLLLVLILMVTAVNVILPNRTAVLGITVPLMMSLAPSLRLNPMTVGLMVPIVAQTTVFYPVQLATALVTYRTRHYSTGELFRAGVILMMISIVVLLGVAIPWWGLMGEPIRP